MSSYNQDNDSMLPRGRGQSSNSSHYKENGSGTQQSTTPLKYQPHNNLSQTQSQGSTNNTFQNLHSHSQQQQQQQPHHHHQSSRKVLAETQVTGTRQTNTLHKPKYSESTMTHLNDKSELLGTSASQKGSSNAQENRYARHQVSPEHLIKRFEKDYADIAKMTLDEINRELDGNMNEIVMLFNRRKSLIINKKRKLRDEFIQNGEQMKRMSPEDIYAQLMKSAAAGNNTDLQQLVKSAKKMGKISKLIQTVTSELTSGAKDRQQQEIHKSNDFWASNKSIEQEVDQLLKRLKYYDEELEKSNEEVTEISKNLDAIEEDIRELLAAKDEEHVQRAEPLFVQKKRCQDVLTGQLIQRDKVKDEKIALVRRIIDYLAKLRDLREQRLKELMNVFGIDEHSESSKKITHYIDFVDQLENLAKVKENMHSLEEQEDALLRAIDADYKQNDSLFFEIIKLQSEEAKHYLEYQDNLAQRSSMNGAIQYFVLQDNLSSISHLDIKDILKRFKENILFLKPLVEEDVTIRAGLDKTCETINTFVNILKSSENEKERKRELMHLLEVCIKLKDEEESKTELLRNTDLEITKKVQQKNNLEEDLDNILNEADLESFKKHSNNVKYHEGELQRLYQQKRQLLAHIGDIENEVIQKVQLVKTEFDDIIREIVPTNLMNTYDLQRAKDMKQVKNYLKKAFLRTCHTLSEFRI